MVAWYKRSKVLFWAIIIWFMFMCFAVVEYVMPKYI